MTARHLHTDECLAYAAKTRHAFCIVSCADAQRQSPAMTFEQALDVMRAIIDAARAIRRRHFNWHCECCGATYHPKNGPPPKENTRTCPTAIAHGRDECWCGHAHFRELWQEWDRDADDWRDDG